jgi:hypothetical protein
MPEPTPQEAEFPSSDESVQIQKEQSTWQEAEFGPHAASAGASAPVKENPTFMGRVGETAQDFMAGASGGLRYALDPVITRVTAGILGTGEEGRQEVQRGLEADRALARERSPVASFVGGLASQAPLYAAGSALAAPLAAAAKGVQYAAPAIRMAGQGAAGALAGAAERGTAEGAALGGVGGAVGQGVVGEGGGALVRKIGLDRALGKLRDLVGEGIGSALGRKTSRPEATQALVAKAVELVNRPEIKSSADLLDLKEAVGRPIGQAFARLDRMAAASGRPAGMPLETIQRAAVNAFTEAQSGLEKSAASSPFIKRELDHLAAVAAGNGGSVPFSALHDWHSSVMSQVFKQSGGPKLDPGNRAAADFARGVWDEASAVATKMAPELTPLREQYRILATLAPASKALSDAATTAAPKPFNLTQVPRGVLGPGKGTEMPLRLVNYLRGGSQGGASAASALAKENDGIAAARHDDPVADDRLRNTSAEYREAAGEYHPGR